MISVIFDDLHQLMFFFCLDPQGDTEFHSHSAFAMHNSRKIDTKPERSDVFEN